MIEMSLADARGLLGAGGRAPDAREEERIRFRGVATDSRRDCAGALFFALRGPNFDAHDFVDAAARAGAVAAVTERPAGEALPHLVVDDARQALVRLAVDWRRRFEVPFVAVTGSNGKTTVKEMVASILRRRHRTLATAGNLNTDIGLASTLLCGLDSGCRRAVVEIGANRPGEIAELAGLCAPRVGVVTQCAPAHLEGFGSIEGVARVKGELFESLPPDGVGVVNADDAFAPFWAGLLGERRSLRFGLEAPADVGGTYEPGELGSRIRLATPEGEEWVDLALPGRHNVMNALAATAAGLAIGESLSTIREGLEAMRPVPGRLCIRPLAGRSTLIDDTYNANPGSLRAALDVLAARAGERWLILGDMAELGKDGRDFHREAGRLARERGVLRLYGLGPLAAEAVEGFGPGGRHHPTHQALVARLRADLKAAPPVTVLVKGSRSMAMESIVHGLEHPC